jgi:SAM-dependent methyltransferase
MTAPSSPIGVVLAALPALRGARVLDIGCGGGAFAEELCAEGAIVAAVDPEPAAAERARRAAPGADIRIAGAEALPFPDAAFDCAVFVNALHHVPPPLMDRALAEALRVLAPGGRLVVIEPLAEGSFFQAVRRVDDETEVRRLAQEAVGRAVASGRAARLATHRYDRVSAFGDVDQFLALVTSVSPERAAAAAAARDGIIALLPRIAGRDDRGRFVLVQPIRADVLGMGGA